MRTSLLCAGLIILGIASAQKPATDNLRLRDSPAPGTGGGYRLPPRGDAAGNTAVSKSLPIYEDRGQ
jgi:hypothetical protein